MTISTNLAGVGDAGEFPCGEMLKLRFLLESDTRAENGWDGLLDQDGQQNIFIALSLP